MDHLQPNPKLYNVPFTTDSFNGMPYQVLGRSGLRVSAIGLGTWKFGYPETGDSSRVDARTAMTIFDRAIDLGVTFWDTANRYNFASGNSERIIGQWLSNNPDQRRNVVLATKVYGGMDGVTPNHSRASRGNILDSLYACLQRMQQEYIDILYFHRFDSDTPVEESLATVDDIIRRGIVRYFAVSNFSADQLKVYDAMEHEFGPRIRVLAVQNRFDILNGESQPGVLDYCAERGVSYVPYSPLAKGLLTDRYVEPSRAGAGDRLFDEGTLQKEASEEVVETLGKLSALAKKWELELGQLVLAYTLSLPGMGPLIPSSSTVAQVESNAKAGKIVFSESQKAEIRAALDKETE